ncbi:MAG: DUF7507 domain-containing protein [Humibacter sp.]
MAATSVVLSPQAAEAAAGTPGVPQPGSVLYQENFQNAPVAGATTIGNYVSASGATYSADPIYQNTALCNGLIFGHQATDATLAAANFCGGPASGWYPAARSIPAGIGAYNGMADPTQNLAVAEQTIGGGAPSYTGTMLQGSGISVPTGSRFVTFSVQVGNLCSVGLQALDRFYLLDGANPVALNSSDYNVCADAGRKTFPVDGQTVTVGTFTGNQAALVNSSSIGFRLTNQQPSGNGNDQAFDNFTILDVTPQLDKSFSPAIVSTGGVSTLTFTVTNTAELAAKAGWSFTDSLPAGLTIANPASVGGTCQAKTTAAPGGATIAVTNGNLTAGQASCTITVPVTSPVEGSFTNGPGNVRETGLNPPGNTTVSFESPKLTLVKHAGAPVDVNGNGITDVGDTIQYTFDVTNSGDVPITNVAVNDSKVGGVTCPSITLAVRASETCSADSVYAITAADAAAGAVDNTATATGTSPRGATVISGPSSTHTPATTAAPKLTVVKSADPSAAAAYIPGQVITYHFAVTNTGNVTMNGIGIDEIAFDGSGTISVATCPLATLAAGDQEVCTATYRLTPLDVDNGSVTNTAVAHGTPEGSTTPLPSNSSTVTIPQIPAPGISVVKRADPGTVSSARQTITYSFAVTNTGNVTLTDPQVNDTDFSGTGQLSAITCPQNTLVAGQVETCSATYTVTQADVNAGTITNTATATATAPGGTPVTSAPSSATVTATRTTALMIVKTADVKAAQVGQTVTYSFLITNTGNVTLTDPQVNDTDFSGTGQLSAITCPQGVTLQPGDHTTCTTTYTVTQADVDAGKISNTATATGTPPAGMDSPTSTPSSTTVTTDPMPALAVVKTADTHQASKVGQVVTYTFAVTNTGNVDISGPKVNEGDFTGHGKMTAVTCPGPSTLPPGQTIDCTATYTVVAADLTGGGSLSNTATVTGTTPGGDPITSDPSTATVSVPQAADPAGATPAAGLADTGSNIWAAGLVGTGLVILGLLAAAAVRFQRRNRLNP